MKNNNIDIIKYDLTESGAFVRNEPLERTKLDYEFFQNFRSEHTIKSYRNDIQKFWEFIIENFVSSVIL